MSYEKFYPNGWQSGESGGTPITPEAMNHIEEGIQRTYSDFAPAGYGLGGQAKWLTSADDLNNIWECGYYSWYDSAPANAPSFGGNGGAKFSVMHVKAHYQYGFVQEVTHFYYGNGNLTQIRTNADTLISEWEWVNPPMAPGVEYRTTKRWNGKTEWTSLTKISGLPNNAYGMYYLAASYCENMTGKHISYERSDGAKFLEYVEAGEMYFGSYGNPYVVFNKTQADLSNMTAYVTLFYTKTTD